MHTKNWQVVDLFLRFTFCQYFSWHGRFPTFLSLAQALVDGDDWDHFLKDNLIHVQRYKDRQLFDGCIFVTLGSESVRG